MPDTCPKCGQPMVEKKGRFGAFLACSGYPNCKTTKPLNGNERPAQAPTNQPTKQTCEKCGSPMLVKNGRYGPFLACSGYPDCRNIKNIEQKTGVTCPECGQGDIVVKRSRMGKTFYSCNRYPDCKFALWQRPTGDKCPECGSLLIAAVGSKQKCSNKECNFQNSSS